MLLKPLIYMLPIHVAVVFILAVDRLRRELRAESAEASKDARIAPQFDLGQEV